MNNEPCTVVLTFDSVEENVWSVTIQINPFWQYLYKVVFVFTTLGPVYMEVEYPR